MLGQTIALSEKFTSATLNHQNRTCSVIWRKMCSTIWRGVSSCDQERQALATPSPACHDWVSFTRGHAMDRLKASENQGAGVTERISSAYVPPLQLTKGQPPPIAANGGLSYMALDRDGDAGTAAALEAALRQIAEGEEQAVIDRIANAPPGPIATKWGVGFRSYAECLEYIRANHIAAPAGGVALPLPYTVLEQPSYSIVSSNALWRDPARAAEANMLRSERHNIWRECLHILQVLRDGR